MIVVRLCVWAHGMLWYLWSCLLAHRDSTSLENRNNMGSTRGCVSRRQDFKYVHGHESRDRMPCRGLRGPVDRKKCHTRGIVKLDRELAGRLEQLRSWDGSER